MSPEGVFILGGRSCPRRAERSRNLGKMLVASGGIALRRLIDPPELKMPSGDGNSLQIQGDPPAPKLTADATGRAAKERFRHALHVSSHRAANQSSHHAVQESSCHMANQRSLQVTQEWPHQAYRSPLIRWQINVLEMQQIGVLAGQQQH